MITSEKIIELWKNIQDTRPLVHCITNIVTVNDCANILLAAGASPTMSHHPLEVEDVTAGCRSLVLNMGAMECLNAMAAAGRTAVKLDKPVVLDPVGAAGAEFRRKSTLDMIRYAHPTCVRGNYSEIKALLHERALGAGVDVQERDCREAEASHEAALLARKIGEISGDGREHYVVASGAVDYISDGKRTIRIESGSHLMSKVTGMGCMASALLGAFVSVERSLEACAAGCLVMGLCGEIAEERTRMAGGGTGTFHVEFLDAVSLLGEEQIKARMVSDTAERCLTPAKEE